VLSASDRHVAGQELETLRRWIKKFRRLERRFALVAPGDQDLAVGQKRRSMIGSRYHEVARGRENSSPRIVKERRLESAIFIQAASNQDFSRVQGRRSVIGPQRIKNDFTSAALSDAQSKKGDWNKEREETMYFHRMRWPGFRSRPIVAKRRPLGQAKSA
jgi:hypothetical protein